MPILLSDPNARQRRAEALRIARRDGYHYDARNARHQFYPGKFEGEPFEVAYFYDAMLNGFGGELLAQDGADEADGEMFDLDDWDRAAFDVPHAACAVLWYSPQGFVSLEYVSAAKAARITAAYASE